MLTVGNKISGTFSNLPFEGVIVGVDALGNVYVEVERKVANLPATYHFQFKKSNILSFHINNTNLSSKLNSRKNVVIDPTPAR